MNENIKLIDYEEKYADIINEIEEEQWGRWCTGDIRDEISTHTIIKLAQTEKEIAGIAYGKIVGDAFYIQVIVIKPQYQHQHIGSMFMDFFIEYSKQNNLVNIICEGVLVNNKMNIENTMKKYGFKEMIRIKEYWGYRYPTDWCKECGSKPCKCTNVIFVKELKEDGD